MELYTLRTVFVFGSLLQTTLSAKYDEPMCTSRFDFEEKLLDKLVRMEHAMELLQDRVSQALTAIEQDQLQKKQDFTSFKDDISQALTTVEQEKLQMKRDFTSFKDDIKNKQTNALVEIKDAASTIVQQNENKLERMSQDLVMAMNKSANDKVVFAAQSATGKMVNDVPTFETVHVNVGGAYDVNTGTFTCRVDGIYTFTFSLRSLSSRFVYCYITKNRSNENYAISDGVYDTASVTVTMNLIIGDVVGLGDCQSWDASSFDKFSFAFSGFRI